MNPLTKLLFGSIVLLLSSCGGKSGDQQANGKAFDSVTLTTYSGSTAVAVTHEVHDYKSWLEAYNKVSDPSSRLSNFASPEDPNLITVFELTRSHQDAKSAFASNQFRENLKIEGVTSEPQLSFFDVKYLAPVQTDKIYRLGVSHEVDDYDHWRKIFDSDESIRSKANLELRAISTNADNPKMVNILFATDNLERAKETINSEELKRRMKEAGVQTEPIFAVFRVPDTPK